MEFIKDENADYLAYVQAKKYDDKEKERIAICKRAEFLNVTRALHARRLEDEFYREYQSTQAGTANAQMRKEQDERLSKDILELNRNEIRDTKYRQHFMQTSPYLRNVQNKLREAYNKKEVATQIAEVQNNRQKEKNKEHYIYLQSKKAFYDSLHKDYLEAQEAIDRKAQYRKDLQNQMITKAQDRQREYEDKMRERKEIEEIVKRMNDEDVKELQIKKELQRKTQEEIDKYLAAQALWKAENGRKLLERNQKEEQLIKDDHKKLMQAGELSEKQKKQIQKDKWLQNVAKDWLIKDQQKLNYETTLKDYQILSCLEKQDEDDRKKREKAIATRIDEYNTLEKQCREKEERDKEYYIEDKRWGEVSKQVDAEYNNKVKKKADDQRKYFIDLRKHHEHTAKLHTEQRAEEFNLITLCQNQMKEQENKKKEYLENERLKLLKAHAPNIHGFIPSRLLKKEDFPHLGEDFTKRFYERK